MMHTTGTPRRSAPWPALALLLLAGSCDRTPAPRAPAPEPEAPRTAPGDSGSRGEPAGAEPSAATLAATAERMRARLGEDFEIYTDGFFVAATDVPSRERRRRARNTLVRCTELLYEQFFDRRPSWPIEVYLFRKGSYMDGARMVSGSLPSTPYGYYSSERRALVMNIETGTGTLVHEMVHAFMDADFPDVRAWFNEGLGSLYEQCSHGEHGLIGRINWRYPVLIDCWRQRGDLLELADLVALPDWEFYDDDSGLHYAEARYFCMYLQERGLLEKFFRRYRAGQREDPSGRKALEVTAGAGIETLDAPFRKFVRSLKESYEKDFPREPKIVLP